MKWVNMLHALLIILLFVTQEMKIPRPLPLLLTPTLDTTYRKHFVTAVCRKELTLRPPYHPTDAVPLNRLQYSYHYKAASRRVSLSTKNNTWLYDNSIWKPILSPNTIVNSEYIRKDVKSFGIIKNAIIFDS